MSQLSNLQHWIKKSVALTLNSNAGNRTCDGSSFDPCNKNSMLICLFRQQRLFPISKFCTTRVKPPLRAFACTPPPQPKFKSRASVPCDRMLADRQRRAPRKPSGMLEKTRGDAVFPLRTDTDMHCAPFRQSCTHRNVPQMFAGS